MCNILKHLIKIREVTDYICKMYIGVCWPYPRARLHSAWNQNKGSLTDLDRMRQISAVTNTSVAVPTLG